MPDKKTYDNGSSFALCGGSAVCYSQTFESGVSFAIMVAVLDTQESLDSVNSATDYAQPPENANKNEAFGYEYMSVSRTSDCLRDQFLALLSLRESKQIRWKLEMQSQASRWTSGSRNGLPILDDLASGKAMFLSISEC